MMRGGSLAMGLVVALAIPAEADAMQVPAAEQEYRIESVPVLSWRVGEARPMRGDPPEFLHITGVAALSTGEVIVADHGSLTLRAFGPDGTQRWVVGRRGQGPGEFHSIGSAGILGGDTVWVHDVSLARVSYFSPSGRFLRVRPVASAPSVGVTAIIGVSRGATVTIGTPWTRFDSPSGLQREQLVVSRVTADGLGAQVIARSPGLEQLVEIVGPRDRWSVRKSRVPLGYGYAIAIAGSNLILGATERYRVEIRSLDGDVRRVVRLRVPVVRVRGELLRAWAEFEADGDTERAQRLHASASQLPLHESAPEIEAIVADEARAGHFWVRRFAGPKASQAEWIWHDGAGTPLGRLALPADWELWRIERDRIIALQRSADGETSPIVVPLLRQ